MPWISSKSSLTCLHSLGSPTSTGTIWLADGITGNPAFVRRRFSVAARSW